MSRVYPPALQLNIANASDVLRGRLSISERPLYVPFGFKGVISDLTKLAPCFLFFSFFLFFRPLCLTDCNKLLTMLVK